MRNLAAGLVLLAVAAPQSWAWGREGHRLTALVAEHYLTPQAKAQAAELLKGESLADVAPWADEYRSDHPETGAWHYVDIPASAAEYDRNRDCPVSTSDPKSPWRDCVTDRILYFEGRLGDTSLPPAERAVALKFLVHLIGDIHQPFHAMGDDRGGNKQGLSEKKYTERLLQEIADNHWERLSGGSPAAWANISHRYAVNALAPNGALITHQYVNEESKVVDSELALGGLRLARVLNRILAPDSPEPGRTPMVTPKP
jgi:hypothetical protein